MGGVTAPPGAARSPSLTTSLADVLADGLAKFTGMSPGVARLLADQILLAAARRGYGGCDYYLPTARFLSRHGRDDCIRADHAKGVKVPRLCVRYGLSRTQVYRILRERQNADAVQWPFMRLG